MVFGLGKRFASRPPPKQRIEYAIQVPSSSKPISAPFLTKNPQYTMKRFLHPEKVPRVPTSDTDWGLWFKTLLAKKEVKEKNREARKAIQEARRAERNRRLDDCELYGNC